MIAGHFRSNKYTLTGMSVIAGLLSSFAWSEWCSGLILLVSFVPFFLIEDHLFENRNSYSTNAFFVYCLPGWLVFSIITLGWLRSASIVAAVAVILGMTFLLSFTAWLVHMVRLKNGNLMAVIALVSFWLSMEYLSLNIDIITPWINLGNGLARDIFFIQWYEFTGCSGGTLWIILSNTAFAAVIIQTDSGSLKKLRLIISWLLILITPALLSLSIYYHTKPASVEGSDIVIIQPNFDPFTTKFTTSFKKQLEKVISMAEKKITKKTSWVITPETTVDDPVNESKINGSIYVYMLRIFAEQHPGVTVVSGMTTYKVYPTEAERPTRSARFADSLNSYLDHFNAALKIDTTQIVEIYHKSKLVPGVEKQFLTGPGKILSRILPYLGGSQWGYGDQPNRNVFTCQSEDIRVAPIICYESAFGKYVTDYVKNGANFLFIITNDGWWKNTNGYKHHFNYAALRAIETRRPIARCGNTGISAFIDIRGNTSAKTLWWTESTLSGTLIPETRITTYVKYGDWLLKLGTISSLILLTIIFARPPVKKIFNKITKYATPV